MADEAVLEQSNHRNHLKTSYNTFSFFSLDAAGTFFIYVKKKKGSKYK